jgi:hypothetical protein
VRRGTLNSLAVASTSLLYRPASSCDVVKVGRHTPRKHDLTRHRPTASFPFLSVVFTKVLSRVRGLNRISRGPNLCLFTPVLPRNSHLRLAQQRGDALPLFRTHLRRFYQLLLNPLLPCHVLCPKAASSGSTTPGAEEPLSCTQRSVKHVSSLAPRHAIFESVFRAETASDGCSRMRVSGSPHAPSLCLLIPVQ